MRGQTLDKDRELRVCALLLEDHVLIVTVVDLAASEGTAS